MDADSSSAAEIAAPGVVPPSANREGLFRQVVDDYMGIVLKTACAFTIGQADRDDLVQEILLSIWQALPAYNQQCKLSTYLYRIAHNRALNWQRSRSRYQRKLQHFADYPHLALAGDDARARERQFEWLYTTLRRLPAPDRTLIMLQLDQLPHREIAEITGLSETNVGVRIHRIKQWLTSQKNEHTHEL